MHLLKLHLILSDQKWSLILSGDLSDD